MNRLSGVCFLAWLGAVWVGAARPALGADWSPHWLGHGWWPDCIGRRCCDDLHPKPLPCPWPVKCLGCDDYCPKPLPCAVPVRHFCHDDYARKCLPVFCGPPRCDLVCPPSACPLPAGLTGGGEAASTVARQPARHSPRTANAENTDRR